MKYYPFRGYNSNHNLDPLASHRNSGKRKDSYSYTNIYVKKKKRMKIANIYQAPAIDTFLFHSYN